MLPVLTSEKSRSWLFYIGPPLPKYSTNFQKCAHLSLKWPLCLTRIRALMKSLSQIFPGWEGTVRGAQWGENPSNTTESLLTYSPALLPLRCSLPMLVSALPTHRCWFRTISPQVSVVYHSLQLAVKFFSFSRSLLQILSQSGAGLNPDSSHFSYRSWWALLGLSSLSTKRTLGWREERLNAQLASQSPFLYLHVNGPLFYVSFPCQGSYCLPLPFAIAPLVLKGIQSAPKCESHTDVSKLKYQDWH